METAALVVIILITAVLFVFAVHYFTQLRFERRFHHWQQTALAQWEQAKNQEVRGAISQSRAVLGGKFTEQMAPFLPEFRYDPTEARFIGSPVDFIIFPGLSQGDPREIVILEVKSSPSGGLTTAQRKIRQLIEDGMVRWELIQKSVAD